MIFEFVAVIVAGFAGAGVALLLRKLSGGRLPRWLTPVGAGAAMLAVAISNEYGWYPRTVAGLPEGMSVAMAIENRAPYRPWTYVKPFVSRFLAVDGGSVLTSPADPGLKLADVYAFARWTPPRRVKVAVDCGANRRADVDDGVTIGEDGSLTGADWREVGPEDDLIRALCGAG